MRPGILVVLLLFSLGSLRAQNTLGGGTGDPSAVLDLQSSSQGVLLSRLTTEQRSAIVSPATGLLIYNTSLGCVEINTGSSSSPVWRCMVRAGGSISSLGCVDATLTGDLLEGVAAEGVEVSIPYAGGNKQWYNRQQLVSTGVTGLTATLSAGAFADDTGSLSYVITGTPSAAGTASFALDIGGQSCTLELQVNVPVGAIASLDCAGATGAGGLTAGIAVSSAVSSLVPYTGGNGFTYEGQVVNSTGVTGLTATLVAGSFANGSGNLTYTITGTPSGAGTASFALNIGGQSCTLELQVNVPVGAVASLDCAGATSAGRLTVGIAVSGVVSSSVPYTGGNGFAHQGQVVNSTGVTGLTATLVAGSFANGSGNLTYTITGTPVSGGTASFPLEIGGQSCTLTRTVDCSAYVASGVSKRFMCHNLGANTSADPFTPSWELNGHYYQWGRNPSCFGLDGTDGVNPCSSPVYGAATPSGSTTANDNVSSITGWSTTAASNGAWADGSKTVDDPCPAGWRVPTFAQLTNLADNTLNPRTSVGTWTFSSTNYVTGYKFGQYLYLPAAGFRFSSSGSLGNRGNNGFYWSSSENVGNSRALTFNSSAINLNNSVVRTSGYSVRCIEQ